MSKFSKLTTTSGDVIAVRENNSKRTYTIKTSGGKWKTYPMNKETFNNASYWTANDWREFLKTEDYHKA